VVRVVNGGSKCYRHADGCEVSPHNPNVIDVEAEWALNAKSEDAHARGWIVSQVTEPDSRNTDIMPTKKRKQESSTSTPERGGHSSSSDDDLSPLDSPSEYFNERASDDEDFMGRTDLKL
jgi:hypothetical protein